MINGLVVTEGSNLRPCDENLATQLEEGYLKVGPFRSTAHVRSVSQPRPTPPADSDDAKSGPERDPSIPRRSVDDLQIQDRSGRGKDPPPAEGPPNPSQAQPQRPTHRLFGAHMNSIVTYQDAKTAWILTDDFLSRMSTTVYQRFVGDGYVGGVKVVRSYNEPKKGKPAQADSQKKSTKATAISNDVDVDREGATAMEGSDRDESPARPISSSPRPPSDDNPASQSRIQQLQREMSDLVASVKGPDPEQQEEEARKREEKEIQDDYRDDEAEDQGREIEHLILVTHGIGQRLGLRMESVNFVHDVNILRKTLKNVYGASPDLQALNAEVDKSVKNSRVQVLPVCWRHLLDFPKQSLRQNRKEHDLGDTAPLEDEEKYPSLDDITVEGVPAVRNLITDLALDILLYQSAYCEHIARIVQRECNRIVKLFIARNPGFKGHISLMGHSLGSAILFDVLCQQNDPNVRVSRAVRRRATESEMDKSNNGQRKTDLELEFDVDSFFCVGSPIGLFQMLKGRTIAAHRRAPFPHSSSDVDSAQDSLPLGAVSAATSQRGKQPKMQELPLTVSSPKCSQLYNIFHPTDPISYRMEPLISSAMSTLKPQLLPYTKKGIFGAPVGQGLSGIGARVGQSVSGLWTTLSSGIASSILNRSLGITAEEFRAGTQSPSSPSARLGLPPEAPLSIGAGTNISGGKVIPSAADRSMAESKGQGDDKKRKLGADSSSLALSGEHPPTLIDTEMETLYAGFQKRRKSHQSDEGRDLGESPEWEVMEERARKLREEEEKVKALNANGRVDYSIQE